MLSAMNELLTSPQNRNKMHACLWKQGKNLILHNFQPISFTSLFDDSYIHALLYYMSFALVYMYK